MKFNLTKQYYTLGAVLAVPLMAISRNTWAQDNPFGAIEDKGNELIGFLTGTLATTVLALIIIISTGLIVAGRMSWQKGVPIALGAVVIGASVRIAEWLMGVG